MAVFHPVFSLLSNFPSISESSLVRIEGGARHRPCRLLLGTREIHSISVSLGFFESSGHCSLLGTCSGGFLTWWIYWAQLILVTTFQEAYWTEVKTYTGSPSLLLATLWEAHVFLSERCACWLPQAFLLQMHIAGVAKAPAVELNISIRHIPEFCVIQLNLFSTDMW
jgi:hypothetical protein